MEVVYKVVRWWRPSLWIAMQTMDYLPITGEVHGNRVTVPLATLEQVGGSHWDRPRILCRVPFPEVSRVDMG